MIKRRIEKLVDGEFIQTTMPELKDGDTFRMFEDDGSPVTFNGVSEFVVEGEPMKINPEQVWGVNVRTI